MKPSFGSDRVRLEDDRWVIACRFDKGWQGRLRERLTRADFPGTAVAWEGELFEVVQVRELAGGALEYLLDTWHEENVLRHVEGYDSASELRRAKERERARKRERYRRRLTLLAPLVGLLPAEVQLEIESEYGVSAQRSSFLSAALFALLGGVLIALCVGILIQEKRVVPLLLLPGVWLAGTSTTRMLLVMLIERPAGDPVLAFGWAFWRLFRKPEEREKIPDARMMLAEAGVSAETIAQHQLRPEDEPTEEER
jgi:hypothetical protein